MGKNNVNRKTKRKVFEMWIGDRKKGGGPEPDIDKMPEVLNTKSF